MFKLNYEIPRLAFPLILSNLTIPLLGLINTAMMGHLQHELYLGVIGLGSMIFNFIYWAFGFIRMSSTGLIAQAVAKEDYSSSNKLFYQTAFLSIIIGLLLVILQKPLGLLIFSFIHGSNELLTLTQAYYHIRIYGAVAVMLNFLLTGAFVAIHKPKLALLQMLTINGSAIILGLAFVYGLHLNSNGIALADVISQYIGFLISVFALHKVFPEVIAIKQFKFSSKTMMLLFVANRDIFIRTLCLIIVFTFFTLQSSKLGSEYLAANTLLMNIFSLYAYAFGGFDNISESMLGVAVGQKNQQKIKEAIKDNFVWACIVSLLATAVLLVFSKLIVFALTDLSQIRDLAMHYLPYAIAIPLVVSIGFLFDAIAIGASLYKQMRNAMLITCLLFFMSWIFLKFLGNTGLWLTFLSFFVYRALTLLPCITKLYFRIKVSG